MSLVWGAHAPRVLVSAPSPKRTSCRARSSYFNKGE
jgi:hypothetical protein